MTPLLRLRAWDGATGRWMAFGDGLFPITEAELRAVRAEFARRYAALLDRDALSQAPQTVARAVLAEHLPALSPFDVLALGYAVTNPDLEVNDVPWPVDPALRALAARCPGADQGRPRRPRRRR